MGNLICRGNIPSKELFFVVLLLFSLLVSLTNSLNITIFRNSTTDQVGNFVNSVDKFDISSRQCANNIDICTKFGGTKLQDGCECSCSEESSTFGLYNKEWKCSQNSAVRQHAGCSYYLQRPSSTRDRSPLYTLPVLSPGNDNNFVYNLPGNCTFLTNNATFLRCNGSWGSLTRAALEAKLNIHYSGGNNLLVGPYRKESSADPSLDGRVVRIPINCSGQTWAPSQCVAFKIKGTLHCRVGVPINNSDQVPGQPTATTPTTATGTVPFVITQEKEKPTSAVLVAMIAGSVAGGAVFVIIILVIILLVICFRRRLAKKSKNDDKRAEENLAYDQSMTLSGSNALRPLPEPPAWPYSSFQRGPSPIIRTPNGTIAATLASNGGSALNSTGEPLYGSIDDSPLNGSLKTDDTYSRLDRTLQQSLRAFPNLPKEGMVEPNAHSTPAKSGTLMSNGSGFSGFESYDVVGGQIDSRTLPRRHSTFLNSEDGRENLRPEKTYDVPESVISDSTLQRPKDTGNNNVGFEKPSIFQSLDRRTIEDRKRRGSFYEAVWDDGNEDEFVTKIELT